MMDKNYLERNVLTNKKFLKIFYILNILLRTILLKFIYKVF